MSSSAHPRETSTTPAQPAPVALPALEAPAQADVLGIPLALTDYERTMEWMDAMVRSGERGYVVAAAVHCVMVCQEDDEMRDAVLGASLTVPDGQPLKWALNALGHDLSDRVYGPTLMARYCERSAETGVRMYLYGGRNQGALAAARAQPAPALPGHPDRRRLLPAVPPADRRGGVRGRRARSTTRAPTSSGWASGCPSRRSGWRACATSSSPRCSSAWAPPSTSTPTSSRRRPTGCRRWGLEWLYRLIQEPRRLWRRYLRYNPRFVFGFLRQYAGHLRARRRSRDR